MQFLSTVLVFLSIGAAQARSEDGVVRGVFVGGPHGNGFDDGHMINGDEHRRISKITFYGCNDDEHPFGMTTTYRKWESPGPPIESSVTHGTYSATDQMHLDLGADEYITDMWFTTFLARHGPSNHRTRIGSIALMTNKGRNIKRCGADDPSDDHYHQMDHDHKAAVLYLTGSTGNGIDSITPYWVGIDQY